MQNTSLKDYKIAKLIQGFSKNIFLDEILLTSVIPNFPPIKNFKDRKRTLDLFKTEVLRNFIFLNFYIFASVLLISKIMLGLIISLLMRKSTVKDAPK